MALTYQQKHYIKKNIKKKNISHISIDLDLSEKEIIKYLKKHRIKYTTYAEEKREKHQKESESFDWNNFVIKNTNIFIFLVAIVFISYFNSIGNDFVSDDIASVLKNENLEKISNIFSFAIIGSITRFIYFVISNIFGVIPEPYRLTNIIFHAGSVILIYSILNIISRKQIALASAAIFAVHPILTESITWISGASYVIYSFFFLLSFLFYLLAKKDTRYYRFSAIFFALSILSSEKAIPLLLVFFVYELSYGNLRLNWKRFIPHLSIAVILTLTYINKFGQRVENLEAISYQESGLYNPLHQIPIAIFSYLRLIFWPDKLSIYHTEMMFSSFQYTIFLFVFILFISIVIYGWKKNKLLFFWLSFFVISLLPTLTPFRISWVVAERYVYLGSLGIIIVTTTLVYNLIESRESYKKIIYSLFFFIVIAFSIRTIIRNIDWKNEDNLWIATGKTSPSGQNIHNNLGDVYGRQKNYEKAVEEFKKAIEINPNYADAYHNLGNIYIEMKQVNEALENYQKAVLINPKLWQSYQNIAAIYFERGDYQKSYEMMKKAAEANPNDPNIQGNLKIIESKLNSNK